MSAIFQMAAITRDKKWAVKIQHCPISSTFDMWVDNDRHFQDGHHNTAQIQHRFVRLQRPELVPDIEKFLPISIFKMAATIRQKFSIVQYHQNLICG
jgi:hypothetical protein